MSFSPDALWLKSRVFLDRGIQLRHGNDFAGFHLWAALSLELLGKWALAAIHPALIADPTDFPSLLQACGQSRNASVRSIMAKTVYERLSHISKSFDDKAKNFAMLMANQRNEELHSGSSPALGLNPRAWVPDFWRVAQIITQIHGKALTDWAGQKEAQSAQALISDASKVLEEAVRSRIASHQDRFQKDCPEGSPERKLLQLRESKSTSPLLSGISKLHFDAHDSTVCPACGCKGWLFGMEWSIEYRPPEFDPECGWDQLVDITYVAEAFGCGACGLRLAGRDELNVAGLVEEFVLTESREPDYEPDYGND